MSLETCAAKPCVHCMQEGEQAGGQHLPGEAGISLGLARGGPKPRPGLYIPAILILLFLYLLTLQKAQDFCITY